MLYEMEQPQRSEAQVEKINQAKARAAANERPKRAIQQASFETAITYGEWINDKDLLTKASEGNLVDPPGNAEREGQKRRAAEKHHDKQQRKLELQQLADAAKIHFGLSTLEKTNKKKREEMLGKTAFEQVTDCSLNAVAESCLLTGQVHGTRYTVHSTRYTVHSTQYTVHGTRYTVHGTQYTVHSTRYTVHST
jgi:hypothetical protein